MDIFGIGPFEIVLVLIVAFVFLGPRDMAKTGRTVGRFLRKIVMSDEWRAIRQVAQEIRTTPNRLIREAGIEEEKLRRELGSIDPLASKRKAAFKPQDFEELEGFTAWTQQPPVKARRPAAPADAHASEPPAPDPDPAPPES